MRHDRTAATAGNKGYAMGVIVDMLSGVVPGSSFLDDVHGP